MFKILIMKMTRFLSVIVLILGCAFISFGQQRVAKAVSPDNFETSNKNGIYFFQVSDDITADEVARNSEYYTMYFSVVYSEKNHQTVITMKDMDDSSKHVISRFFISLGIREIGYNGANYSVEDFYQKFLKSK